MLSGQIELNLTQAKEIPA